MRDDEVDARFAAITRSAGDVRTRTRAYLVGRAAGIALTLGVLLISTLSGLAALTVAAWRYILGA